MAKQTRGIDEGEEPKSTRPLDLDSAGVYYDSLEEFGGSWAGLRRVGDAETGAPPEGPSPGRPSPPSAPSPATRRDT